MSPYGSIAAPEGDHIKKLIPRTYALPQQGKHLTVVPVADAGAVPADCLGVLADIYDEEVRRGRTYPQETPVGLEGCLVYFFSHACFIGVIGDGFDDGDGAKAVAPGAPPTSLLADPKPPVPMKEAPPLEKAEDEGIERPAGVTFESLRAGRRWEDCLAGMYYIKPNYPGRSSHVCNSGFLVDPSKRGLRLGSTLAQSYLHFAPRLGYRGSVFNLVYASNVASVAIWDRLGFTRAGLIPQAGRLKTEDGRGEEYADAIVYWKSFVEA